MGDRPIKLLGDVECETQLPKIKQVYASNTKGIRAIQLPAMRILLD